MDTRAALVLGLDCRSKVERSSAEMIGTALELARLYSQIDGEHHKVWVIDQMVRALTNCPMVTQQAIDVNGNVYTYEAQGESAAYRQFITEATQGDDGPDTYGWDNGIAP